MLVPFREMHWPGLGLMGRAETIRTLPQDFLVWNQERPAVSSEGRARRRKSWDLWTVNEAAESGESKDGLWGFP